MSGSIYTQCHVECELIHYCLLHGVVMLTMDNRLAAYIQCMQFYYGHYNTCTAVEHICCCVLSYLPGLCRGAFHMSSVESMLAAYVGQSTDPIISSVTQATLPSYTSLTCRIEGRKLNAYLEVGD